MWDNETPLQLLKVMPKVLEKEHLEKLQKLFEADKYKNQLLSGSDVCGTYAPFCYNCNKENEYPCAVAYVNYLKAQGAEIEIASDATVEDGDIATEVQAEEQPAVDEEKQEEAIEKINPEEEPPKTKIRIAIARKKTLS